jgi:hypothetical protein
MLLIAAFLIFLLREHNPGGTDSRSLYVQPTAWAPSPPENTSPWLLAGIAAVGVYLMFRYSRQRTRTSLAGNQNVPEGAAQDRLRIPAADQLRDALAIFNSEVFQGSEACDPASLYRSFAAARVELQKRNCRFMYDEVGASHIQAVQQMLVEMDDDFSRQWPGIKAEFERSERSNVSCGSASAAYLLELRTEIREELVHAELRYRRLLHS